MLINFDVININSHNIIEDTIARFTLNGFDIILVILLIFLSFDHCKDGSVLFNSSTHFAHA